MKIIINFSENFNHKYRELAFSKIRNIINNNLEPDLYKLGMTRVNYRTTPNGTYIFNVYSIERNESNGIQR